MQCHGSSPGYAVTKCGSWVDDLINQTLTNGADSPFGPLRIARVRLAVRRDRARLGVLAQMLDPKIGFQSLPVVGRIPQRNEESCLEPADRMRRREKVSSQLLSIDFRPFGVREKHLDGIHARWRTTPPVTAGRPDSTRPILPD